MRSAPGVIEPLPLVEVSPLVLPPFMFEDESLLFVDESFMGEDELFIDEVPVDAFEEFDEDMAPSSVRVAFDEGIVVEPVPAG